MKLKAARGEKYAAIAAALIAWFRDNQRDLIFRRTTDPYAILVSEIMLQQTQVATVVPYFERFLLTFPDAATLAAANEQDVMALWAGLGYYRRARNLHAAAKMVCTEFGGNFPRQINDIMRLPGVGRYTAGAVASFAYNDPLPILEANSSRVLARVFGLRENIKTAPAQAKLWNHATKLIPPDRARSLNYSVMELGALVCTPTNPACPECPITAQCVAFAKNRQNVIPVLPVRREKIDKSYSCIVVSAADSYLIRRIPDGEWHAGLYEFPKTEHQPDATAEERFAAAQQFARILSKSIKVVPQSIHLRYTVTHHSVTLHVFRAAPVSKAFLLPDNHQWVHESELTQLPMGAPQKRIVKLLQRESDFVGLL